VGRPVMPPPGMVRWNGRAPVGHKSREAVETIQLAENAVLRTSLPLVTIRAFMSTNIHLGSLGNSSFVCFKA
jgi:hypothetical protein